MERERRAGWGGDEKREKGARVDGMIGVREASLERDERGAIGVDGRRGGDGWRVVGAGRLDVGSSSPDSEMK